jgi:hypothetical protein
VVPVGVGKDDVDDLRRPIVGVVIAVVVVVPFE